MPGGLGDDARLLGEMGCQGVIEIVRVFQRVCEHKRGSAFAIDVDDALEDRFRYAQRIVDRVEELDFRAEDLGGPCASSRRPAFTSARETPAFFQANWLSPRSPNERHTIFIA
jgi:hypothetical protein